MKLSLTYFSERRLLFTYTESVLQELVPRVTAVGPSSLPTPHLMRQDLTYFTPSVYKLLTRELRHDRKRHSFREQPSSLKSLICG